jgi:hypothetical protein
MPLFILSACGVSHSTARRASLVGLGTAAGAGAGAVLGDNKPLPIAGGAVAGAAIGNLALGDDSEARREGFDEGYVQGQSDSIKRLYFLRHEEERRPLKTEQKEGRIVHYVVPPVPEEEGSSKAGEKKPESVTVRVVE